MATVEELRKKLLADLDVLVAEAVRAGETGEGLAQLDHKIRARVLAMGEQVVRVAASARSTKVKKQKIAKECDDCDGPLRFRQVRLITVRTCLTGAPLQAETAYLTCPRCSSGHFELKHAMRLDPDGFTPSLVAVGLRASVMEPFESAADVLLGEIAGIDVSKSKLHSLVGDVNDTAWSLLATGELGSARLLKPGERLYVEIDGVMAHVDEGWHEIKLAVIFAEGDHGHVSKDRNAIHHRTVVATRGTREELGGLIFNAVARWLPEDASGGPIIAGNVVVISDGAAWIRNLVDDVLPGARVILDWYHAVEHVQATARALYEDDGARKRWAGEVKNKLAEGRLDDLLRDIGQLCMRHSEHASRRQSLQGLHDYLSKRRDALNYAGARMQGLHIGSGVAESTAKNLIQLRMKRPGMRWESKGADAMIALRCAHASTGGMKALLRAYHQAA
jgi:Zn finger protein HypA/HybF involved in hydrogenase expression